MAKEIEKKWIFKGLDPNCLDCEDIFVIEDYYYLDTLRIRRKKHFTSPEFTYFITSKSKGDICRDEYSEIIQNIEKCPDVICKFAQKSLRKLRYIYRDNTCDENSYYEINKFINYELRNLCIVEREFATIQDLHKFEQYLKRNTIDILGQDVTDDKHFYGYNLFQTLY